VSRQGAAVLGSPIGHSLSPALHNAAYEVLGLTAWHYRAIECTETELEATLHALDAEGLAGVSLTMPLKRAVMGLLTYGGDSAITVGAANTVLFSDSEGQWLGTNTDVPGMVAALRRQLAEAAEPSAAAVLGSGATAASALAALAALSITDVDVFARRSDAAAELIPLAESVGLRLTVRRWEDVGDAAAAPVVVSTVPADATGGAAASVVATPGVLFDVIYSPWPTPLAHAWAAAGGTVIGGVELLVEQAALQVELMTGLSAPVEAMRAAGYTAVGGT
jgi:shikimate dehydrogenase